MPEQQKHLWEVDHPFYCADATWLKDSSGAVHHYTYASWADFCDSTSFEVRDTSMDLLVRWDWSSWRRHPDPMLRADEPDLLDLFFVIQRKGFLCSHSIHVTDDDEPAVRAFLEGWWNKMTQVWAPLSTPAES